MVFLLPLLKRKGQQQEQQQELQQEQQHKKKSMVVSCAASFPKGPRAKKRAFFLEFCASPYQNEDLLKIVHIKRNGFLAAPP